MVVLVEEVSDSVPVDSVPVPNLQLLDLRLLYVSAHLSAYELGVLADSFAYFSSLFLLPFANCHLQTNEYTNP